MLALSMRDGEYVTIGDDIVVQVVKTGDFFRLAIDAPRSMAIVRSAIHEQMDSVPACIRELRQKTPPGYKMRRRVPARTGKARTVTGG